MEYEIDFGQKSNVNYGPFSYSTYIKKQFKKNEEAFRNKKGICYTDKNGKEYTYDDLAAVAGPEAAEDIFSQLDETLEETLKRSWNFHQCKRCGHWAYNPEPKLFGRDERVCPDCRPVKTHGAVKVNADPYEDKRRFFRGRRVRFNPGVTTLAGCNGIGKTTLLHEIEDILKSRGTPVLLFDANKGDSRDGTNMLSRVLSGIGLGKNETIETAIAMWQLSEGERIRAAMVSFAGQLLERFKKYDGFGEYWLLFDAIDSGLSLDMIAFVKEYLFGVLLEKLPKDSDIYIICSSNSYELSEGTQIFAIDRMKYVSCKSYEKYKTIIRQSLAFKEKRDSILFVDTERK